MTAWLLLMVAAACEVGFALFLGASDGFTRAGPVSGVVALGVLAVALLSRALQSLPVSVGYAAFTGLAVVGISIVTTALGSESFSAVRLLGVSLVIVGVAVLRLTVPT